jgi:hypothetical protein
MYKFIGTVWKTNTKFGLWTLRIDGMISLNWLDIQTVINEYIGNWILLFHTGKQIAERNYMKNILRNSWSA